MVMIQITFPGTEISSLFAENGPRQLGAVLVLFFFNQCQGNSIENPILAMVETVCITYFTVEFILRYFLINNLIMQSILKPGLLELPKKFAFSRIQ